MPRLKPPVEWGRTANLARRQISSAREPGIAVDPVTDKTATRLQNLSSGVARGELQKNDCPRRKLYRRFSDRGSIPLRSTKKARRPSWAVRLFGGSSVMIEPLVFAAPRRKNPKFSPSVKAARLLCWARTRGSGATDGSAASIPRRSAHPNAGALSFGVASFRIEPLDFCAPAVGDGAPDVPLRRRFMSASSGFTHAFCPASLNFFRLKKPHFTGFFQFFRKFLNFF